MSISKIKVKNINANYPIFIGNNILNRLPGKIKTICPGANKIALVVDKYIPKKFKNKIKKSLKRYDVFVFEYFVSEKFKSFKEVNGLVEKCLSKKFNRNDILICLGGGILGDFSDLTVIIHLAGEPIASPIRWNQQKKNRIYRSRIQHIFGLSPPSLRVQCRGQ